MLRDFLPRVVSGNATMLDSVHLCAKSHSRGIGGISFTKFFRQAGSQSFQKLCAIFDTKFSFLFFQNYPASHNPVGVNHRCVNSDVCLVLAVTDYLYDIGSGGETFCICYRELEIKMPTLQRASNTP